MLLGLEKVIADLWTAEKIVAMTLFLNATCQEHRSQLQAHAVVSMGKELQDHFFFRLISPTAQDSYFSSHSLYIPEIS